MNVNLARFNMVQQQVRTWDVLDSRVLDLLTTIPRENFVSAAYHNLAFSDSFIPLGQDQVMLPPKIIGRMLQSLNIRPQESVLEIGTGTGYITALLASVAYSLHSIEIFPELKKTAISCLEPFNFKNVDVIQGDAFIEIDKFSEQSLDVIVFTGSVSYLPDVFLKRLKMGGRLFAYIGEWPVMSAFLVTRNSEIEWTKTALFETYIPPLLSVSFDKKFEF
jgi:protein-L-isoaspartate(D-aspartate) O-methyltransferase